MQDLQIECENCGTTLTIVREWPDGWKYRATVEPCLDCIEEAKKQSVQSGGEYCTCKFASFVEIVIGEICQFCNRPRR